MLENSAAVFLRTKVEREDAIIKRVNLRLKYAYVKATQSYKLRVLVAVCMCVHDNVVPTEGFL